MLCDIERNLKMFQRALDLVHNVAGGDLVQLYIMKLIRTS